MEDIKLAELDMLYPAFPPNKVRAICDKLADSLRASLEAERNLFSAAWWEAVRSGERPPTESEKDLMRQCVDLGAWWEDLLMRCHFMIEANLKVRQGTWSIAWAQYLFSELGTSYFRHDKEVEQTVVAWCARLQGEAQSEEDAARLSAADRDEAINDWRTRFKAMHDKKPVYIP